MAKGPALSTAKGGEVYVGSEFRDSFLDILHANQFEGEIFDCEAKTEENFYRGAPPNWLNFHISEKAEGTATPFIKRDVYETLKKQIEQKRKSLGISTVKLFHQQGCGGTTVAMQVLWDLRKVFRCAVLTDSTSDVTKVAEEVVRLFTAGSRNHQNTVLLLVNDEKILENLQGSIMKEASKQNIDIVMPVVILLNCVRVSDQVMLKNEEKLDREETKSILLQKTLSDAEKVEFNRKKQELSRRFPDQCKQFHGFNILQTNFSQDYIREACAALQNVKRAKLRKALKTQLVAMLSLLNAYAPGSYLLESQCLDFLRHEDDEDIPLEDQMQPFSHLIITFQQDERSEKKVRMAHTMIAQCCTELLAEAGVTRSDTARNFCRNEDEVFLFRFVKDMLTKRENKQAENSTDDKDFKEGKEKFSRLIIDITTKEKKTDKKEGEHQCVSVLKLASKKFDEDPFFPQALARFYYLELKEYKNAEFWANCAMKRDDQNSSVADTLGQVYKHQLKKDKKISDKPGEILQMAKKAIEAFEHEKDLAELEEGPDMKEHGNTKISHFFNYSGIFGYLQVCNTLYDKLVIQNETWKEVLTKKVSMGSVLESLGDNKLIRFNNLIVNLRDKVEKKCIFLEKYMNYSKPNADKDDPEYLSVDTSDCYRKFVEDSTPKQIQHMKMYKEILADMPVKAVKDYIQSQLNKVSKKEICPSTDSETALAKLIHAAFEQKMVCGEKDPPELHMLALLLHWPDSEDKCVYDLNQLTQQMHSSYENSYKKYFRSRYLLPLFFIGKDKDLNKIVHREHIEKHGKTISDWRNNWKNETIFKEKLVQELLLRIDGVVKNYRLYATVGGKEIEMGANQRNSLWKNRSVTFYLGFTISGPVAFAIQNKTADTAQCNVDRNETARSNSVKDQRQKEAALT